MKGRLDWSLLLNPNRLGNELDDEYPVHEARTPFERDCHRIIFSDAFRRLGKKTQVHPLSKNDHIHSRLTHSQEVAVFGKSLACCVWDFMEAVSKPKKQLSITSTRIFQDISLRLNKVEKKNIKDDYKILSKHSNRHDFSTIVKAASLAHDIGNPPFGHDGEEAFRSWVKSNESFLEKIYHKDVPNVENFRNDIRYFEGNAQGMRLVMTTEGYHSDAGLNLSYATLGSMVKYPWTSTHSRNKKHKYNYLQSELEKIKKVNSELGLGTLDGSVYARHPLSYLMEASDDACYSIIDLEDAIELNIINIYQMKDLLASIYEEIEMESLKNKERGIYGCVLSTIEEAKNSLENKDEYSTRRHLAKYRSSLMQVLTNLLAHSFLENYDEIMMGKLSGDVIENSNLKVCNIIVNSFKSFAREKIYKTARVSEFGVGCNSTMRVLLDSFFRASDEMCTHRGRGLSVATSKTINLMSTHTKIDEKDDHYTAYLKSLDFISGMTDNYATYLAKQFQGNFHTN